MPANPESAAAWSWADALPARPSRLAHPVSVLRLDGPDTLRFLHGQSSADLALARAGERRRTCFITPTARMLALADVLVDASGAWLLITAGDGVAVRAALDRVLFPADAVRLGALEPALWLEAVGPDRRGGPPGEGWELLPDAAGWRIGGGAGGGPLVLRPGVPMPAELAARPPLSASEQECLRLALGLPAAPAELNDDTNPFELGLARRVSLSKGCYVGQEALARLATYDGVKQQLRRWFAPAGGDPGQQVPQPGAALRDAGGERAGRITSALALEGGAGWIGLALVRRAALGAPRLWCGEGDTAAVLELSQPLEGVPPPVGAGGTPAAS